MPRMRSHCDHRRRFVVEHEAQRVRVMDRDVQHHAPARLGLLHPPALQMGRQIDGVEHPREQRLADSPLLDRGAHRAVRRGIAQMMVRAQDHAALAAFGDHCARVSERQRQRLLAQHVLSGRGRGEDLVAMQLVRRRYVDRVDLLRRDQIGEARRRMGDVMLASVFAGAIRVRAHDGNDFATVGADRADHMLRGNRAGSDQSPPEFGHESAPGLKEVRSSARRADDEGRGAQHRFRLEVPARELAHQKLRGAGAEIASVDRDARQGRQGMLGLFDVVEADHGEFPPDLDAGFGEGANESDRDDVVETKGGGRSPPVQIEQLRRRRRAARVCWSSSR